MKIFVVTQGCYSDYKIVAVCSNKKFAQKVVDEVSSKYDKVEIEEFDLDPAQDQLNQGFSVYQVRIKRDGTVLNAEKNNSVYVFGDTQGFVDWYWQGQQIEQLVIYCWARDQEHAIKIANERRIQVILKESGQ